MPDNVIEGCNGFRRIDAVHMTVLILFCTRASMLLLAALIRSLATVYAFHEQQAHSSSSSHNDADLHVLCGVELERGVRHLPSVLARRRLTTHALQHALQASEWLEDTLSTIGELGDVSAACACLCCLLGRLMPREFVRAASAVSSWSIVWRNLCSGGTIVSSCEAGRC